MHTTTVAVKRPLSVWIIALWNILFAGIIPLLVTLSVLTLDAQSMGAQPPILAALFSLALALGMMVLSAGAWLGREWGRWGMLALVVVHYGGFAYRNLVLGLEHGAEGRIFFARMILGLLWIGLTFLYMLHARVDAFFRARRDVGVYPAETR